MLILAVETSCDETAAALLEVRGRCFKLLSDSVSSQAKIHARYGGIVPEVAARKQMEMILPVIQAALPVASINQKARDRFGMRIKNQELRIKEIKNSKSQIPTSRLPDYIAVTNGPGLITSLRVGVETARTLSYVWNKPLVAVNHLEGHIYASAIASEHKNIKTLKQNCKFQIPKWKFPVLALIVSGGHTQLVLMRNHLRYKIVGETLDDAAGEAFDKVAKILNLGYPGGPIISKMALSGDPEAFNLPRPMLKSGDFNFSFSGLKTAVLYLVNDLQRRGVLDTPGRMRENGRTQYAPMAANICAAFQQAVVDVLVKKTIQAAEKFHAQTIILGGGVAANRALREQLKLAVETKLPNANFQMPNVQFSGDNAAMIGVAACFRIKNKKFISWQKIKTEANLRLR